MTRKSVPVAAVRRICSRWDKFMNGYVDEAMKYHRESDAHKTLIARAQTTMACITELRALLPTTRK